MKHASPAISVDLFGATANIHVDDPSAVRLLPGEGAPTTQPADPRATRAGMRRRRRRPDRRPRNRRADPIAAGRRAPDGGADRGDPGIAGAGDRARRGRLTGAEPVSHTRARAVERALEAPSATWRSLSQSAAPPRLGRNAGTRRSGWMDCRAAPTATDRGLPARRRSDTTRLRFLTAPPPPRSRVSRGPPRATPLSPGSGATGAQGSPGRPVRRAALHCGRGDVHGTDPSVVLPGFRPRRRFSVAAAAIIGPGLGSRHPSTHVVPRVVIE